MDTGTLNIDESIIPLTYKSNQAISLGCLTTTPKKEMIVRALFDYNPDEDSGLPSRGLPFRFGDILHVFNASDSEWWQARHLVSTFALEYAHQNQDINQSSNKLNSFFGIIPSKIRVERRSRQKCKRVNFTNEDYIIGSQPGDSLHKWNSLNENLNELSDKKDEKGYSLDRQTKLPKTAYPETISSGSFLKRFSDRFSRKGAYTLSKDISGRSYDNVAYNLVNGYIAVKHRSYEQVMQTCIPYNTRPVVLLGPLKEQILTKLLEEHNIFAACVSHTSRPQQSNEVDGKDFYFISDRGAMQADIDAGKFIEYNEFRGHLFATSAESIRNILKTNHVCLLEVTSAALPKLEAQNLYPFVILIKPESIDQLKSVMKRYTDDQAEKTYEKCQSLLDLQGKAISATVPLKSFEYVLEAVKMLINVHGRSNKVWLSKSVPESITDVPAWRKESLASNKLQRQFNSSRLVELT